MPPSDRSDLGELLDCKLVAPATGGVPRGERLRGDVVCAVAEIGGAIWQQHVEVRGVDVRLVPVDDPNPIGSHTDVARCRVAVDDAGLMSGKPRPRCSASGNASGGIAPRSIFVPVSA